MSSQDEYRKKPVHKLVDSNRNIKKVIVPHKTLIGKKTKSINSDTVARLSGSSSAATLTIRDDTQSWNRLELNNGSSGGGNIIKFVEGGKKRGEIYQYNSGDLVVKTFTDDLWLITNDDLYLSASGPSNHTIFIKSDDLDIDADDDVLIDAGDDITITAGDNFHLRAADYIYFRTGDSYSYRMTITPDGQVGIGTTVPEAVLDLRSSAAAGKPGIYLQGFDSSELDIAADVGEQLQIGEWDPSGDTATLNAKIDGAGDFYTNDGTVSSLSDERVKKDISSISGSLNKLLSLRPVTFEFNGLGQVRTDMGLQSGFIAQEIEAVFPNIVSEDTRFCDGGDPCEKVGHTSYKTLSMAKLIPYLVDAIQSLEERIRVLEDK